MNINANPKAAARQVLMQSVVRSVTAAPDGEAETLLGDTDLVVETIALESAAKRFTRTAEERKRDIRRNEQEKAIKKKQTEVKKLDQKRYEAQKDELAHLAEELAANLVSKAI